MDKKSSDLKPEDFALALKLVVRRLRTDAPHELKNLTWTQKSVLMHLEKGPATSAELSRKEGVTPQSMGVAITQLEGMDLIERKPHPTDGRQMMIKLTAKSVALRKRINDTKENWLARAFEKLDKKEREILFKATELIKRMAEM